MVLILIVVEDGLVPATRMSGQWVATCLNPYCSGRWSRTEQLIAIEHLQCCVLILIVVEDGLVQAVTKRDAYRTDISLNPYCSGRWSRT